MILYFIDMDTGKISKEKPRVFPIFQTYGYRNAQAVARLCKKEDWKGALGIANNGIAFRQIKEKE